jgi:hypothetical protein
MPVQEQNAIRSEGLREFISHRPGLLIRWGIPVFFFILAVLAISSWFIQYPDIVNASAKVNSLNAPRAVFAKNGGRLIKLFKTDGMQVAKHEVIGYLESTASHDEVLKLDMPLDTLQYFAENNLLEEIPRFWKASEQPFARLGELQPSHQTFMQGYITFKDYLITGFYFSKKLMLLKDLNNTRRLLEILRQQKNLQEEDLELTTRNYNVHDTLHNEALLNDLEFRNQKSQLINKKMTIPQINTSIISNESQQNALQKEILELDNEVAQQKAILVQLINSYKNMVADWKQKYLLITPISGKLGFPGFLEENQQLQTNHVICYVTNESNQYYVEMLLSRVNFGKVKPGQEVLLKFPGYPAQEFGSVKGRIGFIKSLPVDSGYLAKVILPNGLTSNYNKTIFFNEGLTGSAEIITEKRRLSERFISGLRDLIK